MDPAGPGFYSSNSFKNWKLDKNDASFVDVIHTSVGFGIEESIGHSDFWPNLGLEQPGCKSNPVCSHGRSYEFFSESILSSSKFATSKTCSSPVLWSTGFCKCSSNNCNHMGFYALRVEGSFYLSTNAQSPYSKNNSHFLAANLPNLFTFIFFYSYLQRI